MQDKIGEIKIGNSSFENVSKVEVSGNENNKSKFDLGGN
jgi:hypothetical protein